MTPKEKAKELVEKYQKLDIEIGGQYDGYLTMKIHDAKQCALIAVDEILKLVSDDLDLYYKDCIYWEQVKTEIQSL
jgi:hypothetical protein